MRRPGRARRASPPGRAGRAASAPAARAREAARPLHRRAGRVYIRVRADVSAPVGTATGAGTSARTSSTSRSSTRRGRARCAAARRVREGDARQPGQHVGVRRGDLDQRAPRRARAGVSIQRTGDASCRASRSTTSSSRLNARPVTFGTQRPTSRSASIVRRLEVRAEHGDRAAQDRGVERDVDPRQDPHRALAEPLLERGERVRGARDRVLAAGRVVVDDLDGVLREQRFDVGSGRVDHRQPVGRGAVRVARDVRLHRLPRRCTSVERVLEAERAERVQRGELADAVTRGHERARRRRPRRAARRTARRRARRARAA